MLPSRSLGLWTSQRGHEDSAGLQCLLRVYARRPLGTRPDTSRRRVLFSAVVVGELLYGFRQGVHFERNLAELRSFLQRPYVTFVPVRPVTADRYSRVMTALKAKGRPIPINDVWIATHAMETGASLISADNHFGYVDGIAWMRMEAS